MASHKRKLSLGTKSEIFTVFMKYDTDRNGYISHKEAHRVLEEELGFTLRHTEELMRRCDKNGDGQLSFDEFVQFYFKVQERLNELNTLFNELDRNKDGYISMDEAVDGLRGMAFTDNEIHNLVQSYDANGDGVLQYEEFIKFWNSTR